MSSLKSYPCILTSPLCAISDPRKEKVLRTLSISTTSLSFALNSLLHSAKLYGARHTDSGSKTAQGRDSSSHLADTEDPSVSFFYCPVASCWGHQFREPHPKQEVESTFSCSYPLSETDTTTHDEAGCLAITAEITPGLSFAKGYE